VLFPIISRHDMSECTFRNPTNPPGVSAPEVIRLIHRLDTIDRRVRRRVEQQLAKFGDNAVPALCDELDNANAVVREGAVNTLGLIGEPAMDLLIPMLRSDLIRVRYRAAQALGKIGDGKAVPELCRLLDDPDWDVRARVVEALVNIGDRSAVPMLEQKAQEHRWSEYGTYYRSLAKVIAHNASQAGNVRNMPVAAPPPIPEKESLPRPAKGQ